MLFERGNKTGPGRFGLYSTWKELWKEKKVYNPLPGGGEQERARRMKQIKEGRLTHANGLMLIKRPVLKFGRKEEVQ